MYDKKEYHKNYYQNNKERISKYSKIYYEHNKDDLNKYLIKYKTENKDFIKDSYYYRKLPVELKEFINFEDIKKDRKNKAKNKPKNKVKTTIKTVFKKEKPLIEFIEGKKTILFE